MFYDLADFVCWFQQSYLWNRHSKESPLELYWEEESPFSGASTLSASPKTALAWKKEIHLFNVLAVLLWDRENDHKFGCEIYASRPFGSPTGAQQ